MVDLHAHILPAVDDGPRTLEESIEVCRAAAGEGTRTLVATPHVNADYPAVTAALIQTQAAAVSRALRAAGIELTIRTGAEVALTRAGELSDLELSLLALGGGSHVLVELPWTSVASGALSALRAFASRGYGIVLAHPERAPMVQRDQAVMAELVGSGALCCLNVASLSDQAERRTREVAWKLLAAGLVHVIASDCHDAVRRPPRLASALAAVGLSPDQIDYFGRRAPHAILSGEPVGTPPPVEAPRRRRWWRPRG